MPIWAADPPTQKGKRKRIIISIDDSDSNSDSNNEDRNNDEEKYVTRHRQKQLNWNRKQEEYNVKKGRKQQQK